MRKRRVSTSSVRTGIERLIARFGGGRVFVLCRARRPVTLIVPPGLPERRPLATPRVRRRRGTLRRAARGAGLAR
jgi:hypothetical protein